MIVDTHVHVVTDDLERYPKRGGSYKWPALTTEDLIATMDACGIDRALVVQAFFTYANDNSYAIDAARAHPDRLQAVCVIDQMADDAPDVLSDLVKNHGVTGWRVMGDHTQGRLNDPKTFKVWERAATLGIPVCVAAELPLIPDALDVIARFPNVPVALEHMWGLEIGDPPYDAIKPVLAAAKLPNVKLKICPNNSYAARVGKATPQSFFALLAEHFEPQRMMWGSNYPAHWDKYGKIPDRLPLMQADLAFLGEEWNRWFFGKSALTYWPSLR